MWSIGDRLVVDLSMWSMVVDFVIGGGGPRHYGESARARPADQPPPEDRRMDHRRFDRSSTFRFSSGAWQAGLVASLLLCACAQGTSVTGESGQAGNGAAGTGTSGTAGTTGSAGNSGPGTAGAAGTGTTGTAGTGTTGTAGSGTTGTAGTGTAGT